MGWESSGAFRFDRGPLLQVQMKKAKFKSAYNSLIIGPRGLQCETNLLEKMGWESSDMVRFDRGPLLQGQTRTAKLKNAYNSRIFSLNICYNYFYRFAIFRDTLPACNKASGISS